MLNDRKELDEQLGKTVKRFLRANGSVFRHRVGGSLALSRAIGDKDFKENDALPQEEQMVRLKE